MDNSDLLNDTVKIDSDISETESEQSIESQIRSEKSKSDSEDSDQSSSYKSLENKTVTNKTMAIHQRTAVKLPTFSEAEPEMWFDQVEELLQLNGITEEAQKFSYIHAMGGEKVGMYTYKVKKDENIAINEKYKQAKKDIIKAFTANDITKLRQLMRGENFAGLPPTQMLMRIQNKAGTSITGDALKTIFLDNLPEQVRPILAVRQDAGLDLLAEIAENILGSQVSPTAVNKVDTQEDGQIAQLQAEINQLTEQVRRLAQPRGRSPSRGRGRGGYFRSSSRDSAQNERYCFYHNKFKEQAFRCRSPCFWDNDRNNQKN